MPPPLRFLSPTRLRAYDTCPLQYRYRYLDRLPTRFTPRSLLGNAIHRTLEANFTEKKRTRRDLSLEAATEVFEAAWEEDLPTEVLEGDDAAAWEQAHDDGLMLLDFYLQTIAPGVTPHLVEHRFRFEVPGLDLPVVGTVDLIDQNGVVIDHKTSYRPYAVNYLADDLQLICYAMGYAAFRAGSRLQPGRLPSAYFVPDVRVDVLVTTDPPTHQQLRATYGAEQIQQLVDRSRAVVLGIRTEAFPAFWKLPGRTRDEWVCARCPFSPACDDSLVAPDLLEPNGEDRDQEE